MYAAVGGQFRMEGGGHDLRLPRLLANQYRKTVALGKDFDFWTGVDDAGFE